MICSSGRCETLRVFTLKMLNCAKYADCRGCKPRIFGATSIRENTYAINRVMRCLHVTETLRTARIPKILETRGEKGNLYPPRRVSDHFKASTRILAESRGSNMSFQILPLFFRFIVDIV